METGDLQRRRLGFPSSTRISSRRASPGRASPGGLSLGVRPGLLYGLTGKAEAAGILKALQCHFCHLPWPKKTSSDSTGREIDST